MPTIELIFIAGLLTGIPSSLAAVKFCLFRLQLTTPVSYFNFKNKEENTMDQLMQEEKYLNNMELKDYTSDFILLY